MSSRGCPIRRLPADNISLILQYAVTPNIDFDPSVYLPRNVERVHSGLHYLGRVCRCWHDVSLRTPSTWRHITIFVDAPHTVKTISTSPLNIYLTRSAPLTVCVYLVRKMKIPSTLDFDERGSVEALLSALEGHLERVEVLVVETNQASSLPDLQSLLHLSNVHRLRGLKTIALRCNADDSILQPLPTSSPPPIHGRFQVYPTLTAVHVDGRNLLAMLRLSIHPSGSGMEDIFSSMPMLETFGVNNLSFRVDGYSDELVHHLFLDVLPSFPRLVTLDLDTFEPIDDGHPWTVQGPNLNPARLSSAQVGTPLISTSMPRIIIKHTKQDSIEFVLNLITSPRTLILIRCYFTSPSPIHVPNCSKLVLVDTPTDDHRVVPKMVAHFDGQHLELINCSCIDNGFWAELIKEMSSHHTRRLLPHLISLTIVDCPNFPVDQQRLLMSFLEHEDRLLADGTSTSLNLPVHQPTRDPCSAGEVQSVVTPPGTSRTHAQSQGSTAI